jgi:very-short-patch-repair endonuclease
MLDDRRDEMNGKRGKKKWKADLKHDRRRDLMDRRTSYERIMQADFKKAGIQCEIQEPLGTRFADFAFYGPKIVLEIDGGYHTDPKQMAADQERDQELLSLGWKTIRFTNAQVEHGAAKLVASIKSMLQDWHWKSAGTIISRPFGCYLERERRRKIPKQHGPRVRVSEFKELPGQSLHLMLAKETLAQYRKKMAAC